MRTYYVGTAGCLGYPIYYYLTEETKDGVKSYGVLVKFKERHAYIPNLAPSRNLVQSLLETLIAGAVTPLTVHDIIDDWLLV